MATSATSFSLFQNLIIMQFLLLYPHFSFQGIMNSSSKWPRGCVSSFRFESKEDFSYSNQLNDSRYKKIWPGWVPINKNWIYGCFPVATRGQGFSVSFSVWGRIWLLTGRCYFLVIIYGLEYANQWGMFGLEAFHHCGTTLKGQIKFWDAYKRITRGFS